MAKSDYEIGIINFPLDLAKSYPKVKPSLILKGFGLQSLKTKLYNRAGTGLNGRTPNYGEIQGEETDQVIGTSYLGTPVFMNIEFEPGTYTDRNGKAIEYGGIFNNTDTGIETDTDGGNPGGLRIDTVLCDVSIVKQVITTKIQGVNGSVKEYISQDDYDLTIRGALVDPSGQRYPEEQVLQLVEYCEVPESIRIFSRFLNDNFNIQYLAIKSVNFPQVEGTENVQLFEIKAISDDPIELTINGITD